MRTLQLPDLLCAVRGHAALFLQRGLCCVQCALLRLTARRQGITARLQAGHYLVLSRAALKAKPEFSVSARLQAGYRLSRAALKAKPEFMLQHACRPDIV